MVHRCSRFMFKRLSRLSFGRALPVHAFELSLFLLICNAFQAVKNKGGQTWIRFQHKSS